MPVLYVFMKTPPPDNLDAKLNAWEVNPRVPASFQREVWQRIASRQAAREEAFWPRLTQEREVTEAPGLGSGSEDITGI
jgi:hypothetical protein